MYSPCILYNVDVFTHCDNNGSNIHIAAMNYGHIELGGDDLNM
jgi:hypothetical protein